MRSSGDRVEQRWREICCASLSMTTRHAIGFFSALFVTPLVLGLGVFLLIPVALLLLPALAIAGVAALPAVFAAASSRSEPGPAADPAALPALPAVVAA